MKTQPQAKPSQAEIFRIGLQLGNWARLGIYITVRNPLLLCPLVLAQDGGTRSRQKCLHLDFSATVLFWVIMLGEAIFDIKHDFLVTVVTADDI